VPAGTRGLLRENVAQKDRTAAYRCSQTHGLPCAVVGRLMPCSPGSRIPSGLPRPTEFTDTAPVGANAASARLDRSDDGRDHTVLPHASDPASPRGYARFERRSCNAACKSLTGLGSIHCPALPLASATALLTSTATRSAARDDVRPPLFAGSGWVIHTTKPNFGKAECFDMVRLTCRLVFCPTGNARSCSPDGAQRNLGFAPEALPGLRCAPSGLHT
jgi:hypothetical protein